MDISDLIVNEEFKEYLQVSGSRVHNLKNINIDIPRNKLVVITGLSGSGKSSLAFDTIYAEGQRRYIETFSSYARQFLGTLERPDVDKISGLSPVVAIEQKTTNNNPRSTVGTTTEIYDFLRLLYSKIADAFSYISGEKMIRYTDRQIMELILAKFAQKKITILSPLVKARKGHYRELFENIRRQGFLKARVDGEIIELYQGLQLDRYKTHDIEVVIDRLIVQDEAEQRILATMNTAMKIGKGVIMIYDDSEQKINFFSKFLMCPTSGISYEEPEPNTFSFNSPYGACPKCKGMGYIYEIDNEKIIPDKRKSIRNGAIATIGEYRESWIFRQIEAIGNKYGFTLNTPFEDIPDEAVSVLLYGTDEVLKIKGKNTEYSHGYTLKFEGIINFLNFQHNESNSSALKNWAAEFMNTTTCPECKGTRLKKESVHFRIEGKNIAEVAELDIINLLKWVVGLKTSLSKKKLSIANEIIRELETRISFLLDVGLDYLTLNRSSQSLSGGESQRIRLASQIGSQLVGVLYILDEPSIGLHQRDNVRLINSLKNLRDIGNSVIVVEHDEEMIRSSDYIIDIGPFAGIHGGRIISKGQINDILKSDSLTAKYLNGQKKIKIPEKRREGNGKSIIIKGAKGNNLKSIDIEFPLGKFICVTGVSGSGKSTLINETLYPILSQHFYKSLQKPLEYESIEGIDNINKIIEIDQSPIGRTPRSNPATYTGVFNDIRNLFAMLPESKIRGYKPGRFSFNVKGGRCESCQGAGVRTIEMNFMPDVYVKCETCYGKRYNRETLEVRYKGKSINDVLNMEIDHAVDFFENIPSIIQKIRTLKEVGLGYITLGQQSTTLSGGEAQRVKLATELSKKDTGKTFYILDEPTTGLHFEDINVLLGVLHKLVDKGNTVLVIEHNMDVIKVADHIIDLGPEGGKRGGRILCTGTPEEIIKNKDSYTAEFLIKALMPHINN
ncbi:MAG: excinuclease ABC subunit UvrA [Bacteroidota bacterium]|nr:excinuclease ABC subunit UvrA [Bacteroidota bacterium]